MLVPARRPGLRGAAVVLIPLVLVCTMLGWSPAQAQRIAPSYFGMHDSAVGSGSLAGVRFGSIRLWDTGTNWRDIETSPGHYDFTTLDRAVETARAAGVRPVLVLGQTPSFYASDPDAPGWYGDGAPSAPSSLAPWKAYVRAVAQRYKTKIDYQVWNEPNVIGFWTGTVAQMATLTATASATITKVAGRGATVVAPSFPLRLASQQKWFRKYWASKVGGKSVGTFVDVVSANLYPMADQPPEASMGLLRFARSVLPSSARHKPVWNTEINYGLLGGDVAKEIPEAKQAAFVARTLLLNAGASVRRVFWFKWIVGDIANTHLVDESDGTTLTRAGRAWGVARGWIVGTDVTGCVATSKGKLKGLYTCTARKGKKEVRRIYWKPAGGSVQITTPATTTSWTDLAGHTTARSGRYRITVGESPVMVAARG